MEAEDTGQAALPVRSAAGPEVLEEACPAAEELRDHGDSSFVDIKNEEE